MNPAHDKYTTLEEFVHAWAVQQTFYLSQTVPVTFYRFEDLLLYPWEIVIDVLQSTGFWELAEVDGKFVLRVGIYRAFHVLICHCIRGISWHNLCLCILQTIKSRR